jgi:hypothetical protein
MRSRSPLYDTLLVFAFALAVRVWLIHAHPAIFGGDTVMRLANRDRIQLAYQLPLLQTAIYGVSQVFDGPAAVRYLMAIIGAIASVASYLLASDLMPRGAALATALAFASNAFLIELSIVPFQEVLMLAALMLAFHFFFNGSNIAASVALGAACLTRYEAWAACPVLVLTYLRQQDSRPLTWFKSLLLFGWAPAAWMLYHAGVSAPGTIVVELPRSANRLMRYVYLGYITVKNTPVPILVLAGLGIWTAWKNRALRDPPIQVLSAFTALVVCAILFSAHGESPDPERFVTAREASIWIVAVVFAAGVALAHRSRAWVAVAAAGIVLGLVEADRAVRRDTSNPRVRLAYDLARFLDDRLNPNETALIFTKPVAPELVQSYLDKVARKSGEAGVEQARKILLSIETTPPDYQRTVIHSRLGKFRLRSLAGNVGADPSGISSPRCVGLAAVWSDFAASNPVEAREYAAIVARATPVQHIASGSVSATVYRLNPQSDCRQSDVRN